MEKEKVKKTPETKQKKDLKTAKNKNAKKKNIIGAFTLIELLAVIIILGVIMIIAIPSVSKYINDSRKSSYISTAKNTIDGARNLIHSGDFMLNDKDTTYYIPANYIKTDNSLRTPYGEFTEAYVGVVFNGDSYSYYWISNDSSGQGVKDITKLDKLDNNSITSDINDADIRSKIETTGIDGRSKILILKTDGTWNDSRVAIDDTNGEGNLKYLYYTDGNANFNIGCSMTKSDNKYIIDGMVNGYHRTYEVTHVFDNYQDALNDVKYTVNPSANQKFFLRIRLANDVIDKIDIGYYLNNQVYYLKGLNTNAYQNNKQTIMSSLGSDKCVVDENCEFEDNMNSNGCYETTSCRIPATSTDPGLYVDVRKDGTIYISDGVSGWSEWSCDIGIDWSWCVIPF